MDKNILENTQKPKFRFKDRHILWNWEKSSLHRGEEREFVRYHIIIADDRFIEEKLERIQLNFQDKSIISHPFEEILRLEGKFGNTGLNYLFVSFDTEYPYDFLSFEGVSRNVKRDPDLRERKALSIKDYVKRLYESA